MANNRIYLRCKYCGKELFLGKRFCEGYYYKNYNSDKTLEEKLNEFYDEHSFCNDYTQDCFEINYEDPFTTMTKEDNSNGTH